MCGIEQIGAAFRCLLYACHLANSAGLAARDGKRSRDRNEGWCKMKSEGDRFCRYFLGIAASFALLPVCLAANDFVAIRLPQGVQIELPRNWEVLSKNKSQRITLDSAVPSRNEGAGTFDASSDFNFAGSYFDGAGKNAALVNVRYYPNSAISQADVRAAGQSDIRELDRALRDAMAKGSQTDGFSVLDWHDTSKQVI